MKVAEFDEKCPSCKGTGLYQGMGEGKGFAVVCHTCSGTGKHHFKHVYEEFTKRKEATNVVQVLEVNPGISVGTNDKISFKDFGGMSYEDWKKGKKFPSKSEMRRFTCPAWWYQSANYELKPHWEECTLCGSFSDCKRFKTKAKCWKKFDSEKRK
jgi:hypothetical protein